MTEIEYRAPLQPLVAPGEIQSFASDMTATIAADVSLGAVQQKLASAEQWLPVDGDPDQPVGRLVEFNSTGPLRLGYGAWRDLLLGAQFINGRGELITAGGRAVKNVAGYDLTKFMVGQRSAFGRVLTITTRTYRRPTAALLAEFAPDGAMAARLLPTARKPTWAILTAQRLYLGYLGDERTIDYQADELNKLEPLLIRKRTLEEDIAHRRTLWSVAEFRASIPPSQIEAFVKCADLKDWSADAAFGIVKVFDRVEHAALLRTAREFGGSAWPETGEIPLETLYDQTQLDLLSHLSEAFGRSR